MDYLTPTRMYEQLPLLERMVEEGYVSKQKHPTFDYYIYNYTQTCQFEKMWNPATLQSRGLILNGKGEIIARPFKKFFNMQEHESHEIPWGQDFTVMEKMDGSLGISYIGEDGEVYIATRGSFVSEQAEMAMKFIREHTVELDGHNRPIPLYGCIVETIKNFPNMTFLFEIIAKENRIVVDYGDFEGLVLLGANRIMVDEFIYPENFRCVNDTWRTPAMYDVTDIINELLAQTKDNFEGYVITFQNGFRMKVKLDEYVRLHKLITNLTDVDVWECLMNGDNLNALIEDVPDEFFDDVKGVIEQLKNEFASVSNRTRELFQSTGPDWNAGIIMPDENSSMTRKELALWLQSDSERKKFMHGVFALWDGNESKFNEICWKMVRPAVRTKIARTQKRQTMEVEE